MPHFTKTITTPRSQKDVFEYMADFSNVSDWDPSLISAKRIDEGEIGAGSKFKIVAKIMGREATLRYEHKEFDPPGRFVSVCDTGTFSSIDAILVRLREGGCELTYDAQLELQGPLKLLAPLVQLGFSRNSEKAADELRQRLDGEFTETPVA